MTSVSLGSRGSPGDCLVQAKFSEVALLVLAGLTHTPETSWLFWEHLGSPASSLDLGSADEPRGVLTAVAIY